MIESLRYNREQLRAIGQLKKLIWLYFFLLIFEGALRKWVLPGLATPLLIVRDPVALGILGVALYHRLWQINIFVSIAWFITFLGLCSTLVFGHGYLSVALYGMRIMLLHFPLIFIIGRFFNREDLLKMGKVILWITIGMTILVALQFYSPQNAWVNRGVGGDLQGSGFSGANGFYRVPGTFSFTNGLSLYYGLAACFIFYFTLMSKQTKVNKLLLAGAVVALAAAVPLSISRTVFFQIAVTLVFVVFTAVSNKKVVFRILGGVALLAVVLAFLGNFDFFQTATAAFTSRFERASSAEGGLEGTLVDRFLGGMLFAIEKGSDTFFGQGLGLGSQAGAKLATGEKGFVISEGEWGRLVGERGLMLGLILILLRIGLGTNFLLRSWRAVKNNNIFPFIMCSFAFLMLLQGQWAQPTALGFGILAGGLTLSGITHPRLTTKTDSSL